ncbi:hypothetical protein [Jannaschia ovalis]|uniref:Curlin associated repeat-containing protein n=1 Tax=Jannaschia ovalis TaxID=3038773 RepID=A0ABY8L9V6_9RHOB|nr:hypothetical protein [Jannaschia sp. GRR-S6-38]WGH78132.1 hypothetical protein P8627_14010 [Jannaschia sp. GRR-S6-38]
MKQALLIAVSLAVSTAGGAAWANGQGESRPFSFRSPSERQVLLMGEQTRLNFKVFERDTALSGGQAPSGQTGNSLSVTITGNGDNTISVTQDNTGDQTIQESDNGSTNTFGGSGSTAPMSTMLMEEASSALFAIPVEGE